MLALNSYAILSGYFYYRPFWRKKMTGQNIVQLTGDIYNKNVLKHGISFAGTYNL